MLRQRSIERKRDRPVVTRLSSPRTSRRETGVLRALVGSRIFRDHESAFTWASSRVINDNICNGARFERHGRLMIRYAAFTLLLTFLLFSACSSNTGQEGLHQMGATQMSNAKMPGQLPTPAPSR